jgi:hypothetical protein
LEVSDQLHALAALPPKKRLGYPLDKRLSGPQIIIIIIIWARVQWLRHYATNRKVEGSSPHKLHAFPSTCLILQAALGPGVHSASNRIECQKQRNNSSGE